jgi:type I restriction enzyme S subunit
MRVVSLEDVLKSLESGARPSGGVSADSGEIPSLGGEHLNADGGFDFSSVKRIPRDFFERMRGGRIAEGDVLVVKDGATTGKTSFVGDKFPFSEAAVNEHVFCVRVDQSQASPGYVFHFLRSPMGQKSIALDFRGATVGGISRDFAKKVRLPLPPLPEQRRIAEILDKADALRAKRRAALAQLDTLTQSIFLDMFGDPATNPCRWSMATLGQIADVQGGLQISGARDALPYEVPYLRVANVHRGFLDLSEIKSLRATESEVRRTRLENDDLLIVEGHGNPAEIGRGALWDGSIPECVHQNHLIRVRLTPGMVTPLFAAAYINSEGGRRHLLRAGKTTSGLNTISVSEVRSVPIAIPPFPLQQEFIRRVNGVELLKTRNQTSITQFDLLFESIQYRAFNGGL